MSTTTSGLDAIILCGGMGTRLRSAVPDRPKGLAEVRGRPFLDLLVDQLTSQGVTRLIFAIGYLGEQIVAHFAGRSGATFIFSREESPLGTGGAVLQALPLLACNPFLVLNGDSICPVDYPSLVEAHRAANADLTIAVTRPDGRADTGAISLGPSNRIIGFREKGGSAGAFVNAGVYVLDRRVFREVSLPAKPSLEYDLFPAVAARGASYGFPVPGELVDIGTPERLEAATRKLICP